MEEQERGGVAIGTPARSERKGAADGAGRAATPWGVGGSEVLINTREVLIDVLIVHRQRGPQNEIFC